MRVALDLRGATAEERAVGLELFHRLADTIGARQTPYLARRLHLLADEASAVVAGANGLGLLLSSGGQPHERSLILARYHDACEPRLGWVARLLSVALAVDEAGVAALARVLPPSVSLLNTATEPVLVGHPVQVVTRLAVVQAADGLDEVICAVAPSAPSSDLTAHTIQLLGCAVLPYFQSTANPTAVPAQRKSTTKR